MTGLSALWLPISSCRRLFVASCVIPYGIAWHKNDHRKVPNEDKLMTPCAARRAAGDYMVPRPSNMQEMRSPAFSEKDEKRPRDDTHGDTERLRVDGEAPRPVFLYCAVVGCSRLTWPGAPCRSEHPTFRFPSGRRHAFSRPAGSGRRRSGTRPRVEHHDQGDYRTDWSYALLTAGTFAGLWPALTARPGSNRRGPPIAAPSATTRGRQQRQFLRSRRSAT